MTCTINPINWLEGKKIYIKVLWEDKNLSNLYLLPLFVLRRLYSAQGKNYPSSYVYHHKKKFGRYSFVAVDATPNPGPKRPFNFFGYIKLVYICYLKKKGIICSISWCIVYHKVTKYNMNNVLELVNCRLLFFCCQLIALCFH